MSQLIYEAVQRPTSDDGQWTSYLDGGPFGKDNARNGAGLQVKILVRQCLVAWLELCRRLRGLASQNQDKQTGLG